MVIKDKAERVGDMHPARALKVSIQNDGDVIVCITQDGMTVGDIDDGDMHTRSAHVEFCVSGGRSRRTHQALLNLIQAIREDDILWPVS